MTKQMANQVITLTDAAVARVKELIGKADKPVLGLRVGVDTRGCSGLRGREDSFWFVFILFLNVHITSQDCGL